MNSNVTTTTIARVQPVTPSPLTRPAMANDVDQHGRVGLTSQYLTIDGSPVVPVSGELHYSRIPRERWAERLGLMRASGVTVVSSYILWIHHQETPAPPSFGGNLDVAEFVRMAGDAGLHVILRIGPWCHGESRNGGLPDWVVDSGAQLRTDDPAYLDLVRPWLSALGDELADMCGPSSPIIGIQIENELYDQPGHIVTLKAMARAAGLHAPLWTATAWGGAELPPHEVLPLYGGYPEGFWVDADAGWDDSFREHFQFSHQWDDPGIGADLRTIEATRRAADPEFPLATCELGGGMATAYHRRPVTRPKDIAAIANAKLGNGSAWQGFYMYAGGINPPGAHGMQESHATAYPNDMPTYDYDFRAPLAASGSAGESLPLLREHNAFLNAFGAALAPMPSALPDEQPASVHDRSTLRWALRGTGDSGFVFVNWHQPYEPLDDHEPIQFAVAGVDGHEDLVFPDEPIGIPAGTIARWPLGLEVGGVRIAWATASPVTVVDGPVPTLVLRTHPGIGAKAAIAGTVRVSTGSETVVGDDSVFALRTGAQIRVASDVGAVDLLLVDEEQLSELWVIDGRLVRSADPIWRERDALVSRSATEPKIAVYDGTSRAFVDISVAVDDSGAGYKLPVVLSKAAGTPRRSYGSAQGRASAPDAETLDTAAARFEVSLAALHWTEKHDVVLTIHWSGDVAQLVIDGVVVADRFWDGTPWEVELRSLGVSSASSLELRILPLADRSDIGFDWMVRGAAPSGEGALPTLRLERRTLWHTQRHGDGMAQFDKSADQLRPSATVQPAMFDGVQAGFSGRDTVEGVLPQTDAAFRDK